MFDPLFLPPDHRTIKQQPFHNFFDELHPFPNEDFEFRNFKRSDQVFRSIANSDFAYYLEILLVNQRKSRNANFHIRIGGWWVSPTGKSFRFVRSCVHACARSVGLVELDTRIARLLFVAFPFCLFEPSLFPSPTPKPPFQL